MPEGRIFQNEDSPDFDIAVRPEGLEDVLPSEAHRAETMENGLVKSSNGCELGLNLSKSAR